jgi:hypothetical protein
LWIGDIHIYHLFLSGYGQTGISIIGIAKIPCCSGK